MTLTSKKLIPDARGRVSLKGFADNVDSFRAEKLEDGSILLTPFVEIPQREAWIYKNPSAIKKLEKGISQIGKEKPKYLGDFTQYANEGDEN